MAKEITDNSPERIIVIGTSSGGFEALKIIVRNLPADFQLPIFIVWHISPDIKGVLAQVLNREKTLHAVEAKNNDPILPNRIYVAPPDHHMLVMENVIRITHGPKENRFRPSVDPLFRSAAYSFGNRVIGVILSGALDDGTAGLWTVKRYGGIAIVQDPSDAEVSSMPANALRQVDVDYCVPLSEIANLLVNLSNEPLSKDQVMKDEQTKKEIDIASEKNTLENSILDLKELSPYTCPECHGVLSRLHNDKIIRYRCHTGHAYSTDSLLLAISEKIEDSIYNAIRGLDEIIILLNHIGDHHAEANQPKPAAAYFQKAKEAELRSQKLRNFVVQLEQLSREKLEQG
jgi:two-component system chemotaxis response regulator CheB